MATTEELLIAGPAGKGEDSATLQRLIRELDILIRARYPLVAVNTYEEGRFLKAMHTIAGLQWHRQKGLFTWSRVSGLLKWTDKKGMPLLEPEKIEGMEDTLAILDYIGQQEKGLFVLCDYAPYLSEVEGQYDAQHVRKLREVAWQIKSSKVSIFVVGPKFPSIPSIEKEVKSIELDLPCEREVSAMIGEQIERLKARTSDDASDTKGAQRREIKLTIDDSPQTVAQLTQGLLGLTETECENALAKAVIASNGINSESLAIILDEKKSVIRGTGALTYTHPEPANNLGGYRNLRALLERHAVTFSPRARALGVEPAKGMLLVGLPGCGKDLAKRIASSLMGRSLLDLDMGSVMGEGGGVIGSAAMTIKRALSIATTVQGILGISEFEKAVGGLASSSRTDGGETARTIGYLLNWMQDQSGVYVFATANDISGLAAEQTRQGRFSQIVFVDLPKPEGRRDIFTVHLGKRGHDPANFDLDELVEKSHEFSGAEIEAAVKDGIVEAFMDGERPVTTKDIVARAARIVPIARMKKEQIAELRQWAETHMAVNADSDDIPEVVPPRRPAAHGAASRHLELV